MFFSLRNRLFLVFTCLLTIPFIIFSFLVPNWFSSVIKGQTQDLTVEMMDQYSLYINSITTQAEDLGKQILVNPTTLQWMKSEHSTSGLTKNQRLLSRNQMKSLLASMTVNNSNGMSVSVMMDDGTGAWGNNPKLKNEKWYKEYMVDSNSFVASHVDPFQPTPGNINSYILPLIDMNTLVSYGIIKVNFPTDLMETALSKNKIGQKGHAYLLNSRGKNVLTGELQTPKRVLTHSLATINKRSDETGMLEVKFHEDTYLVFYQKLSVGGWILLSEVTKADLFSKANDLRYSMLAISGVVFLLTILASYLLSSNIVRPLGKLATAMGYIERGDFAGAKRFMPTIKSQNNEVGYLVKVTEHTVEQLKYHIEIEYETNIRRRDAEYKALLLQINPHFLNNTLEIIGGLAAQGKNKEVMNVSVYLGRMMRYSLNTNKDVVTLGEEMTYIRSYTSILKIRYVHSISITIMEDEYAKNLPIIKFILQPLVENAVKYSFVEKSFADILVQTKWVDGQLILQVEDKGMGMSEEIVKGLLKEETENESVSVLQSKGTSIGLRNVLGRLKLYYGDNFSYKIESIKGAGTKVQLSIKYSGGEQDVESADC
ncbi:histidine kinase [Bacillus sp. FJAT-18017]|uniref:cache domain-containing sensor histidine kinase n=1 Tax=Bacillus sp. FJAT-18017 TaxID=1705566 RepID=UPI0006B042E7|nr:sensor histidine kinase [Bacillus sp. FJAT-18017]ALC91605.1 histidine kinase [Bacillus sp. FJAT-18017]